MTIGHDRELDAPEAAAGDGREAQASLQNHGDVAVDALLAGPEHKWGPAGLMGQSVTVTYSFLSGAPSYNPIESFQAFDSAMEGAARQALAEWSSVATINFVELESGGTIGFGTEASREFAGYTYYPDGSEAGGDVWLSNSFDYTLAPEEGNYGYLTLMHEIGHAIGLKHPGAYSPGDTPPFLPSAVDNTDYTVMSYTNGAGGYPSAVGPYDVQAARYLYGHSGAGTIGNVTFGSDADESFAGDSGVQHVHGRGGADYIELLAGNDAVAAGSGVDTVLGGDGSDLVYGNIGADVLSGGPGSDTIYAGQNDGPAGMGSSPGQPSAFRNGVETLVGGNGTDLLYGNHGSDLILGGGEADSLIGGQDGDTLSGGSGDDRLHGDLGNDLLVGGGGVDRFFFGGTGGDDTIADFTQFTDDLALQRNVNGSGIADLGDVVARAVQDDNDVVIDLGDDNSITLQNYSTAYLISADILIV